MITAETSLSDLAFEVGEALARHDIRAVLTGGACVTLHTQGKYVSHDLDFVLEDRVGGSTLDPILARLGFHRTGNQYIHRVAPFYLEFPLGPLAIGNDPHIRPISMTKGNRRLLALSPTDSCLDRLAAYIHWGDRESLALAAEVARSTSVDFRRIRTWCHSEGADREYRVFRRRLTARPARRNR